ncbi:hypothetical protein [Hyphomicrobium sp.]|uniref:hypothetical protein n=1 Tax=Hyphomicrobium sp. TaxID=82 RepID=UPI0025BE4448|nr:hypothetical protein [Hyphomicrobium sp.]MCC7252964.1 hypothetical protein [Hyphomicrobium sp.]
MTPLRKATISAAGLALVLSAAVMTSATGFAQEGPGGSINPGRDCQTIVTCRFTKGGSYRGCLSSYSCRVCRFEASSCVIGGTRRRCHKSVCTWG